MLIAAGTLYDHRLKKQTKTEVEKKRSSKDAISESSGVNCTTYDLTQSINRKESDGVDISIPAGLNNNNGHIPMRPVTSPPRDLSKTKNALTLAMNVTLKPVFQASAKSFFCPSRLHRTSRRSAAVT
jgi:hypothetical protein